MDRLRSAAVLLFLTVWPHIVAGQAAGDVCQQPVQPGDCRAYIPSFFYDSNTRACERFIYGGCDGNDNRFRTKEACQARCSASGDAGDVCQQPVQPGKCRAYIPSFFYNSQTRACERFIYGGCDGNDNRFRTKEACQARCSASGYAGDVCQQPVQPGDCRAYIPSFFYNSQTRACERFIYGGCDGNDNRFRTKEACQARCSASGDGDVCQLPAESGRCYAYFRVYFYNSKTGACERFVYGGCGGNGNKFHTVEACQAKCLRNRNACQQPAAPGNCYAYMPSYFYNSTSRACEQFIYGGCGGNDNRFQSILECRSACNQEALPIPLVLA